MNDVTPPEPEIRPARPAFWQRLSVVWLVPVLALAISLGVAWQNYSHRGRLVEISFANATGVVAGSTAIKFRDVTVGTVEKVSFTGDLSRVIITARIDRDVIPFLDEDAQFWVVRPQVSVRGISGLDTVLSGVFIEGSWNSQRGTARRSFTGQDEPPLVRPGQPGTQIELHARDGNKLAAGAPILHKGVKVGYIEEPRLSPSGDGVVVQAFIEGPHDRRITSATRFWDTSGFSVSLGTAGVTLNMSSLASLVEGGVSFDTLISGGDPITQGQVFDIYEDEAAARESLFNDATAAPDDLHLSVLFDGSVSGLTPGADVRFRGVRIGEVSDLIAQVEEVDGRRRIRLLVNLTIKPSRLGFGDDLSAEGVMTLLQDYVARGLRARLATSSILTGALIVELVELTEYTPATIDMEAKPYPVLPATEAELSDFDATAEGVFERINALPVEELLSSAISLMDSLERLANDQALQETPRTMNALLDEARALIGSADTQAVPGEVRAAIGDLRKITGELEQAGTVAKLNEAIDSAASAAANIDTAAADLPEITEQVKALGDKANSLAVEELVDAATRALASIDALIGTEDARQLPPALTGALNQVRGFLAELREGGAIGNVNSALASAEAAADAVENAAASLPALSERLSRVVAEAEALLGSYGERSRFNAETLATFRDIQSAANAIRTLARTLERDPNSILFGK